MSSTASKISLMLASFAVAGMMFLAYAHFTHTHGTADVKSEKIVVTGFRDLHGSTSNFGVSFRPAPGAVDYALRIYATDASVMPLDDVWWSDAGCLPFDELDYCLDAGPYLTSSSEVAGSSGILPYWFSIIAKFPDREIEGERFCFDGFDLDASYCPDSEIAGLELVERDGEWVIETNIHSTN